MHVRDLLLDSFGRIDEQMRHILGGLSAEQLTFRPAEQANTIAWLAWHLTCVQDDHMSDLAGREQAWIADGWHARFGRPSDAHETGFGATAEQVAQIRPAGPDVLLEYFAVVYQRTQDYLRSLEPDMLDRELDEPQWNPPVTVGVRLVSVIDDCAQHVGQMAYIRGLIENRHWLGY